MKLKTLLLSAVMLALPVVALAEDKDGAKAAKDIGIAENPNQVRGDEITPRQKDAVEKGLAYLATKQGKDGSFGAAQSGYGAHTGITSLCGLAFMEAGNLPGRGKYGDNVKRAVQFILNNSQDSGLLAADNSNGVMYSHGFATVFLGEVYGMTGDEEIKDKLKKAVMLIQKTQSQQPASKGGWRYNPVPFDADISVTICEIMGLRAARDAGIKVEKETIDNAIAYVKRCQNPDGGFSYVANQGGGGGSGFERSAAGCAALYYAGVFEGDDLKRGLNYVIKFLPSNGSAANSGHYFYGNYYAVQTMFLAGGDYWAKWYPAIREQLISRQQANGGWAGEISEEYCTGIALIILQMPNRYLPVFHGKGPGS